MVIELVPVDGQTPPDPDELAGIKPKHITTQAQLNEWEQQNIVSGEQWALKQAKKQILDEAFVRRLHKKMFGDTWKWAGTFRSSDKTIGIPWEQIAVGLDQLLKNTQAQIEFNAFGPDELALRFHRNLVWIHPFPNGNGRHARLMADLLAIKLGRARFSWGANANLVAAGQARMNYTAALKAADQGQYAPLIEFGRT